MPVPPDARTVTVAAERLRGWLAGFAQRHGEVLTVAGPELVELNGADGARAWIDVPFPPLDGDLAEHVERRRRVGVVLVRRGGHAAGVFDGHRLVASKVDSSYVQGTTKAGGWSQQRYARRRANQSRAAFADAADVAARILLPEVRALDAVARGGDRRALDEVLADPRLAPVAVLVTGPLLAVPDPRLKVLQATPEQFLAVRITLTP
ncbi:MAG: acVLRF1 family peptidyl-tRNA hydrolase [Jatrophihabitantaceae bacterium]